MKSLTVAYRWESGGSELPRGALPKGAAFGRMKKKKQEEKTEKENQERENKKIIIIAYRPSLCFYGFTFISICNNSRFTDSLYFKAMSYMNK